MRSGGGGGRRRGLLLLAGWLRRLVVRAGSALLALAVRAQLWNTQQHTIAARRRRARRPHQPRQRRNRPPTCVCAVLFASIVVCSTHLPLSRVYFPCRAAASGVCEGVGSRPRGGGTQRNGRTDERTDGRERCRVGWLLLLLGFNVQCTTKVERRVCTTSPPTNRSHGERVA